MMQTLENMVAPEISPSLANAVIWIVFIAHFLHLLSIIRI